MISKAFKGSVLVLSKKKTTKIVAKLQFSKSSSNLLLLWYSTLYVM